MPLAFFLKIQMSYHVRVQACEVTMTSANVEPIEVTVKENTMFRLALLF